MAGLLAPVGSIGSAVDANSRATGTKCSAVHADAEYRRAEFAQLTASSVVVRVPVVAPRRSS